MLGEASWAVGHLWAMRWTSSEAREPLALAWRGERLPWGEEVPLILTWRWHRCWPPGGAGVEGSRAQEHRRAGQEGPGEILSPMGGAGGGRSRQGTRWRPADFEWVDNAPWEELTWTAQGAAAGVHPRPDLWLGPRWPHSAVVEPQGCPSSPASATWLSDSGTRSAPALPGG